MKRPFLIEEIMLDGVSGEVHGTVTIDRQSGLIEGFVCGPLHFRRDDTDSPVSLSQQQRSEAIAVVERVLRSDPDLPQETGRVLLSGEAFSPPPSQSAGTRILAAYLESASRTPASGQRDSAAPPRRRAQ